MKRLFLFTIIFFLSHSLTFSQNTFVQNDIDDYILKALQNDDIPGVSVAIVKDGNVVLAKGYGYREKEKINKVDENTLFMIGSNTKAFTATALCLLEYEKSLSLNDKVSKWMPDFKLYDELATKDIMIRDLLCHRLGLQTFEGDFVNWDSDLSRAEIIHNLRNLIPVFPFRSRFGYCNAAFLTAGELIPIVTGKSWDDFIQEKILTPLDMKRTFVSVSGIANDKNSAFPYTENIDELVKLPYPNIDNLAPAGTISSCAKDMANWLLMQLDSGKFNGATVIPFDALKQTRMSNMVAGNGMGQFFPSSHFRNYGLGLFLADYYGKLVVWHTGGVDGFVSSTCFLPEENLGIVILTNTDQNSLYDALRYQIIDSYIGAPFRNYEDKYLEGKAAQKKEEKEFIEKNRKLVAENSASDISLKIYTGTYTNSAYGKIEIKIGDDGKLKIYFSHHPFLIGQLEDIGGRSFFCTYNHPEYGYKVIPFEMKDSRVYSVKITVNDFIDFMPYEFVKDN